MKLTDLAFLLSHHLLSAAVSREEKSSVVRLGCSAKTLLVFSSEDLFLVVAERLTFRGCNPSAFLEDIELLLLIWISFVQG
jgi:hypothetical protein